MRVPPNPLNLILSPITPPHLSSTHTASPPPDALGLGIGHDTRAERMRQVWGTILERLGLSLPHLHPPTPPTALLLPLLVLRYTIGSSSGAATHQENVQLNFGQLSQLCKVVKLRKLPEFDNFGK